MTLKPTKLQMQMVPEPEPEPEPTAAQKEDDRLKTMLNGHSVDEALKAVQEGSELTMYLATGKKKHSRFFWVRPCDNGTVQLCWGKKKGTSRHKAETLHAVLPQLDIDNAEALFREVSLTLGVVLSVAQALNYWFGIGC